MISYVYFCPTCRSNSIDRSVLFGGKASCRACGWSGNDLDLEVSAMVAGETDESLFRRLRDDLRGVVSHVLTLPFGRFLLRWGFTTKEDLPVQFPRYMDAAARGILMSMVRTREILDIEAAKQRMKEGEPS